MKLFRHTVKTLLSFSRGERIGLAVLVVLVASVLFYPLLKPAPATPDYAALTEYIRRIDSLNRQEGTMDAENKPSQQLLAGHGKYTDKRNAEVALFSFDPNAADSVTFVQLGFSAKQASAIIRYRARGAKFRSPDDFAKVYVVDEKMFSRLKPYIAISLDNTVTAEASTKKEEPVKITSIVELNLADTSTLKAVRGIGSYSAKAIVELRTRLGGFTHLEQLLEIRGMNEERLQSLRNQLSVDQSLVRKINLKNADEKTLKDHPYIGAYAARGILLFRKNNARCTLDDLLVNNILQKTQAEKLAGYVEE